MRTIFAIFVSLVVFSPAASKNINKSASPTTTPSPAVYQSSLSGLVNVTASSADLPQPDFDLEVRLSTEEDATQSKKKSKRKKEKNTALKRALKEAARKGMEAMVELYDTVEPTMKRKGQVLSPEDPAAKLAMFSAPHFPDESDQSNRAAYAALFAAKKLKER